jgi:hypothetical protein
MKPALDSDSEEATGAQSKFGFRTGKSWVQKPKCGGQALHDPVTSDVGGGISDLSRVPLPYSSIMRSGFGGALSSATMLYRRLRRQK